MCYVNTVSLRFEIFQSELKWWTDCAAGMAKSNTLVPCPAMSIIDVQCACVSVGFLILWNLNSSNIIWAFKPSWSGDLFALLLFVY